MNLKRNKNIFLPVSMLVILLSAGCKDKQFEERTYMANVPQYMAADMLEASISSQPAKAITTKGKIFLKDNYILLNKPGFGIHVIDNSDPSNPNNISFIEILGNVDMVATGNTLYADTYQDLLVIDFSDPTAIKLLERYANIYPGALPPLADANYPMAQIDETKGVVIGWKVEEITEVVDQNSGGNSRFTTEDFSSALPTTSSTAVGGGSGNVSISGSMARMAMAGNYLYTVGNGQLSPFDISNKQKPVRGSTIDVSWNIETLFPFKDHLLIGTTTGMLVYNLTNPMAPNYTSTFWHANSCDPVVAEGNTAYVTLRGGRTCGGFDNQLDVIDITNLSNPTLIKSYPLSGPYGLGIDNGTLFVCDGNAGLKIYNAADPLKIDQNMLATHPNVNTYDVIPYNAKLIMIGEDGLYQYDYSNLNTLQLLSVIKTQ